jgi:hypothetical protein
MRKGPGSAYDKINGTYPYKSNDKIRPDSNLFTSSKKYWQAQFVSHPF